MSRFRFFRAGAALTAAAFFSAAYAASGPQSILPEYRLSDADSGETPVKSRSQHASVAAPLFASLARATLPDAAVGAGEPAAFAAAAQATPLPTVMKPVAAAATDRQRLSAAEARLAVDIQRHLRRLGCYSGPLNGDWDAPTRAAMTGALGAANARLSVKSAEVTLLAIVELQSDELCRRAPAAPRIETAATPATRPAAVSPLPGMMSVGGPRTEAGEASVSAAPGTSLTQRAPAPGFAAAAIARPRLEATRKRAPSRAADRFFTHPLSREPD